MDCYDIEFYGLKRSLPITLVSPTKMIANFNILGDVEFTEIAGDEMEKLLRKNKIIPDCFVGPEIKIVPFVHHLAKRFGHKRYVILRKSVRGYMISPLQKNPEKFMPSHVKKMVISKQDVEYLKGKKIVLVDDVVSTGATMTMLEYFMTELGADVIGKCSIFKQGEIYNKPLFFLAQLPMIHLESEK